MERLFSWLRTCEIARKALRLAIVATLALGAYADGKKIPPDAASGGGIADSDNVDWTGSHSFLDGTYFSLKDDVDPTKILRFQLSGITAGQTRTITVPDANLTLPTAFIGGSTGATDNAILRADGTGGGTVQAGYSSYTPTISDTGYIDAVGMMANSAFMFSNGFSGGTKYIGLAANTAFLWTPDNEGNSDANSIGFKLNSAPPSGYVALCVADQGSESCANATPDSITMIQGESGSGTDISGGALTLAGGHGTGTGAGGNWQAMTSYPTTTGTAKQTYGDRIVVVGAHKTLTETTATDFARCSLATSGTVAGGVVEVTVEANDVTDYQARTLAAEWSAVNKAGTVTVGLGTVREAVAASAGTLTCTLAAAADSTNIDFSLDCTSSLTQTTLRANAQVRRNIPSGTCSAL